MLSSFPYAITNERYSKLHVLSHRITVPVIVDKNLPLTGCLVPPHVASLPTTFTFSLDEALSLADRHLSISGRPVNPIPIVTDWTNIQRWEASHFWTVEQAHNWYGHELNGPLQFTHEHPRRSGELLAEGISLLFLMDWLKVGRQNFYFIEGYRTRPDYRIGGLVLPTASIDIGLEVRSRVTPAPLKNGNYRNYLLKKDKDTLDKKKGSASVFKLSGVVAVYCFYGLSGHFDNGYKCRIHIADPEAAPMPIDQEIQVTRLIEYYIGVTRRIGLWYHLDRLERAQAILAQGRVPEVEAGFSPVNFRTIPYALPRSFGGQQYRGRVFSSMIGQLNTVPRQTLRQLVQSGEYGTFTFHGVNVKVLDLIDRFQWDDLARFYDPATGTIQAQTAPALVSSDGVVKHEYTETNPQSLDAQSVITEINR